MFMRNDYLRTAFDMFDRDGSGKIDADEICKILDGEEMSNTPTREKIVKYIKEID
jgi:Ca2+-binding EF-hand superfamily protein